VRWIWLGGLFMMAGGLFAAAERRFRAKKTPAAAAVVAEPKASLA
jgi:cytochrome c-type biogenesis protein CcmF